MTEVQNTVSQPTLRQINQLVPRHENSLPRHHLPSRHELRPRSIPFPKEKVLPIKESSAATELARRTIEKRWKGIPSEIAKVEWENSMNKWWQGLQPNTRRDVSIILDKLGINPIHENGETVYDWNGTFIKALNPNGEPQVARFIDAVSRAMKEDGVGTHAARLLSGIFGDEMEAVIFSDGDSQKIERIFGKLRAIGTVLRAFGKGNISVEKKESY